LPDIVEAYIGAIFVDSNFNYGEVQRFFDEHIKYFFENMTIYDTFANNHPTVSGLTALQDISLTWRRLTFITFYPSSWVAKITG